MRMCRGGEIECPGFPDQAVETKICEIQKCTSGSELVKNVANDLRTNLNVDDRKLSFLLDRGDSMILKISWAADPCVPGFVRLRSRMVLSCKINYQKYDESMFDKIITKT